MTNKTITYDDSNFYKLYAAMEGKQRVKALKGACRAEANKVRKVAVNNLRASDVIKSNSRLEKCIWGGSFKKSVGFSVGITTKSKGKKRGFYTTKRQGDKPVLLFAENGSKEERRTKSGHRTGFMPVTAIMATSRRQVRTSVGDDLRKEMLSYTEKVARKYGCT